MLVYFDTEFTDFAEDAKLISIGLVAETGETFYAELSDTYTVDDCSDFVIEHVLPQLDGGKALMTFTELKTRLYNWLEARGEPVTLATDSPPWDWHFVRMLLGETYPSNLRKTSNMIDIPKHLAYSGADINMHHALKDAELLCNRNVNSKNDL